MLKKAAHIPKEDYDIFKENYPGYGSWTWFVRECLRRFNDLHKETPKELIRIVVEGVKEDME